MARVKHTVTKSNAQYSASCIISQHTSIQVLNKIIFAFAIIGSYIGFVGKLYDYLYSKNIISATDIIADHYISAKYHVNAYGLKYIVQCTCMYHVNGYGPKTLLCN